jgi:hypothetical protein
LITQDILCACRCFFSQVGCVLENKGRYFIFGNDVLETPRSPDMNTNRIVNGMLNNDNGTNNKTVYPRVNPQVMWAQPPGKSTLSKRPQSARSAGRSDGRLTGAAAVKMAWSPTSAAPGVVIRTNNQTPHFGGLTGAGFLSSRKRQLQQQDNPRSQSARKL